MTIRSRVVSLPFVVLFTLAGCGNDSPPSSTRTSPTTSASAEALHHPSPGITWGPCPEDSYYVFEPGAECATVPMPIDRDHPHGDQIPIFVARVRSGVPNAPQFWMLDGGPGSSGEDFFLGLIDQYRAAMPTADIYVPAHRGTGRSAGLVCSGEALGTPRDYELSPAEWVACRQEVEAQWGHQLKHFNSREAANDLHELIELNRAPNQPVILYGLSYGTWWVWRFLDLYPHGADAIVQDSVVSPGEIFLSHSDTYFDPVLKKYAALCAADSLCGSKMGPDPIARIEALYTAIDNGHCAASGFTHELLRVTLGQALVGWDSKLMTMAVPYRLERCNADDVTALQTFIAGWYAPEELFGFSHALESTVGFSEFWEHPAPSPDRIEHRAERQLASMDWALERKDVYPDWPKYHDPLDWPVSHLPMLMLNGDLDVETPIHTARVAADHFHHAHQTFVTLPNAPHGAGYQSPTTRPDGLPCGIDMIGSFVANPTGTVDTSCLADLEPLAYEQAFFASYFFNSGSVWENTPVPP